MSVNKAILIGRLGKDPELKYTPNGVAVCSFSLATTERWTDGGGEKQEKTVWHNIVAWGKLAELAKEYLARGRLVYIEGTIDNRSYDKKDGSGRGYISEVKALGIQFLGKKDDSVSPQAGSSPPPDDDGDEPF